VATPERPAIRHSPKPIDPTISLNRPHSYQAIRVNVLQHNLYSMPTNTTYSDSNDRQKRRIRRNQNPQTTPPHQ
jgi:hypothetical protein